MIIPNILSKKGPAFKDKILLTRPNLPSVEEIVPYMSKMIQNRWVTNFGEFHNEFQRKLKEILNVEYVLPCCNATIGLYMLLKALGLKGSVITTPFTFPATVHALTMAGLRPVFSDINPDDYTIDPDDVERKIDGSVSAIMGVHVFGNVCDVEKLDYISSKYKIPVIYDSAPAFMTKYKGKMVGGFGRAEVFSFHGTKLFTTLEGGAIATNDGELYKKLKLLINFGIKDEENVVDVGLNGKMSEMNAIFGLAAIKNIKGVLERLSELSRLYRSNLDGIRGIKPVKIRNDCQPNNQYMPVEIIPEEFGMSRDELNIALKEDNVFTRKYFYPAANHYECYKGETFVRGFALPNVERVSRNILCLPLYATLEKEDVKTICNLINSIQRYSKDILALGVYQS